MLCGTTSSQAYHVKVVKTTAKVAEDIFLQSCSRSREEKGKTLTSEMLRLGAGNAALSGQRNFRLLQSTTLR